MRISIIAKSTTLALALMLACTPSLAQTTGSGTAALKEVKSDGQKVLTEAQIAALTELSAAIGKPARARESQLDVLLIAAALTGLALLTRAGRLRALGFDATELLARLEQRFLAEPQVS